MTLLVASIALNDLGSLDARAEEAWAGGADAVEIRIDTFEGDPARLAAHLKDHSDRTWIVTCRSRDEGGMFTGELAERVSLLTKVSSGTDAYVDFEFADWQRSRDLQREVQCASATTAGGGHKLILSTHDFKGLPANPAAVIEQLLGDSRATAGKMAYQIEHINDSFAALDLMHEHSGRLTAICMGEDGLWTRVLANKLGAFASYCALSSESATAPGQLTLEEMVDRYRWPAIDPATQVFGVLGDPVAHSVSPLLMNRWFAEANVNAVYLPLRIRVGKRQDVETSKRRNACCDGSTLSRFLDACVERPWLDVGGFSVTLPHKTTALNWVGDGADRLARSIGALNTLVFREGKTLGYNTDCHAAIDSIVEALGCGRSDLGGLPVDVLGSGGAARAVLVGLRDFGCSVTIYGRSPEKAQGLAERFDARVAAWEDRVNRRGKIVINCTSVGMWPNVEECPMPQGSLGGCRLVFDLIYNPLETALLKHAAAAGAAVLSGLDMFIRQAAMQFELWTGRAPDTKLARDLVTREIHSRASRPS